MIINADDFGLHSSVNDAILVSFQRRWISSTTLMATMPGFEEACALAHEHRLTEHIGAHLVMTEGSPLTEQIKRCPRLCNGEGQMHFRIPRSTWRLESDEREALAAELTAQVQKIRRAGLPVTHADSHHHAHTVWGVFSVLLPVLAHLRVPHLRLSRNCGAEKSLPKRIYTTLLNRRIAKAGLAQTEYFGSIDDYQATAKSLGQGENMEIMTHPLYNQQGELVDKLADRLMAQAIELVPRHAEAVSYSGHHYD
jgi:predicted glycoside hydrolase/deacetylase ChbG (UPF0249 family)